MFVSARVLAAGIGAAFICLASTGWAQAPRVTFIGLCAGLTCETWNAGAAADEAVEQWAFGFLSAAAAGMQLSHGDDVLARLDANAIHGWLADYCRARPDDSLSVALVRLLNASAR